MSLNVIQVTRKGQEPLYLLNRWPNEPTKSGSLRYFVEGEGSKTTKAFKILDDTLPDLWENLTPKQVGQITCQWGIEVGRVYADCLVAGIIARQTARGWAAKWKAIKPIWPEIPDEIFNIIAMEYMLACFGIDMLDIVQTDKNLAKLCPEYNPEAATYKGESISMRRMCEIIHPKLAEVIDILNKSFQTT